MLVATSPKLYHVLARSSESAHVMPFLKIGGCKSTNLEAKATALNRHMTLLAPWRGHGASPSQELEAVKGNVQAGKACVTPAHNH